jgi:hypothetical protein
VLIGPFQERASNGLRRRSYELARRFVRRGRQQLPQFRAAQAVPSMPRG